MVIDQAGDVRMRLLAHYDQAEPVSYTHLDVYKRQTLRNDETTKYGIGGEVATLY